LRILSLLVVLALLALPPLAHGQAPGHPEAGREWGDAEVAALDVATVFWTTESDTRVALTLRVRDLSSLGQPLLDRDDAPQHARHAYSASFLVDGVPARAWCEVGLAQTSPAGGVRLAGAGPVGTVCGSAWERGGSPFAVAARVDPAAHSFTLVLTGCAEGCGVGPGTAFADVLVVTSSGPAASDADGRVVDELFQPGAWVQ
jgi:hypothetical protein